MSWQAYVDTNLVGTNNVKYAAICGQDGAVWAKSDAWNVTSTEVNVVLKNFGDSNAMAMTGLIIGGDKYFYLSGDEALIRAKKGQGGLHIVKTTTAMIIAMYAEPTQPNQCATVVENLAEYLKEQGF